MSPMLGASESGESNEEKVQLPIVQPPRSYMQLAKYDTMTSGTFPDIS
jgi:hypothetical protein